MANDAVNQNKNYQGFAITSLVIGIIMAGITLFFVFITLLTMWTMSQSSPSTAEMLFYRVGFFINYVGFVSGIIGLKSRRRRMALAGIVLCALAFALFVPAQGYGWLYA